MKVNKKAVENLLFFLIMIGFWDIIVVLSLINNQPVDNVFFTIIINVLACYLITDSGYSKLKSFLKLGAKMLVWVIPIAFIIFLVVRFFSLPPTTIIIVLLLLLIFKKT